MSAYKVNLHFSVLPPTERSWTTRALTEKELYSKIWRKKKTHLLWSYTTKCGPTAQSLSFVSYMCCCVEASPSLCCCWRWSTSVWLLSALFCSCRSCWKDPSGAMERKHTEPVWAPLIKTPQTNTSEESRWKDSKLLKYEFLLSWYESDNWFSKKGTLTEKH